MTTNYREEGEKGGTRIFYWYKKGKRTVKKLVKRRVQDVERFKIKKVHYTLFLSNLENSYTLVGKYPNESSKNYLLLCEQAFDLNLNKIKRDVMKNLKEYKNHNEKFIDYVRENFKVKL